MTTDIRLLEAWNQSLRMLPLAIFAFTLPLVTVAVAPRAAGLLGARPQRPAISTSTTLTSELSFQSAPALKGRGLL